MKSNFDPTSVLREAGFRATPGRIKLLQLLVKEHKPLTIEQIHKKLGRTELNEVTLYRALEALATNQVVRRVDLRQGVAYYEFSDKHHHHIVCTDCGTIEDFSDIHCNSLVQEATSKSSSFKIISSHSMELFGMCRSCAK